MYSAKAEIPEPNGEPIAEAGNGALVTVPQLHAHARRRRWIIWGAMGGISMCSYVPTISALSHGSNIWPQARQASGRWSMISSGLSLSKRNLASCPGLAPPGLLFSRRAFLSIDGGSEDVREVLRGGTGLDWSAKQYSTNSCLLSRCNSSRFINRVNHGLGVKSRGWVVTKWNPYFRLGRSWLLTLF